jgi:hypothetical protein
MIYIGPAGRRTVHTGDLGRTARRRLTTTTRPRQRAQDRPTAPPPHPDTPQPADDASTGSREGAAGAQLPASYRRAAAGAQLPASYRRAGASGGAPGGR